MGQYDELRKLHAHLQTPEPARALALKGYAAEVRGRAVGETVAAQALAARRAADKVAAKG